MFDIVEEFRIKSSLPVKLAPTKSSMHFLKHKFTVLVGLVISLIPSKWSKYSLDVPNNLLSLTKLCIPFKFNHINLIVPFT